MAQSVLGFRILLVHKARASGNPDRPKANRSRGNNGSNEWPITAGIPLQVSKFLSEKLSGQPLERKIDPLK